VSTYDETKFGPQPIREAVWRAGMTHSEFTDKLQIQPSSHVRLAMRGACPPSEELRQRAPFVLGIPLDELFTAESLAVTKQPTRRPRRPAASKVVAS
jgi:ribosome-binding protein aMBF1 (putative translation factor)